MKTEESKDEFPREITFKAVYRTENNCKPKIEECMESYKLKYTLAEIPSSKKKFTSFTVGSFYQSEEELNTVCQSLAEIKGFMMMV